MKLSEQIRKAKARGMERAGTLPAKDAVKVCPDDWHEITSLADMVANLLDEAARACGEIDYLTSNLAHDLQGRVEAGKLASLEYCRDTARATLAKLRGQA